VMAQPYTLLRMGSTAPAGGLKRRDPAGGALVGCRRSCPTLPEVPMLPMHRRALPALLLGAALAFAACPDDGDDGPTDTTTATDTTADATPDGSDGADGADAPDGTGDEDQARILA